MWVLPATDLGHLEEGSPEVPTEWWEHKTCQEFQQCYTATHVGYTNRPGIIITQIVHHLTMDLLSDMFTCTTHKPGNILSPVHTTGTGSSPVRFAIGTGEERWRAGR